MKRPEKCWQCLAVWSRHPNLLQYTLGPCVSTLAGLDCGAAGTELFILYLSSFLGILWVLYNILMEDGN